MLKFPEIIALVMLIGILIAGCENPSSGGSKDEENSNMPKTYTVTFDSNGGTDVTAITGIKSGETITLPSNPTRTNYIFKGWFTDNNSFENVFTNTKEITSNITVYAKWTPPLHRAPASGEIAIYTANDLVNIANNLSGKYVLMNDISLEAINEWVPIGDKNDSFTGNFDGNHYAISGLSIALGGDYSGLFGRTDDAGICNLALKAASMQSGSFIGGIVGYANNTTISNCYTTGTISRSLADGDTAYAGGIVGMKVGGSIVDCYSTMFLSISMISGTPGNVCVGGIAGDVYETIIESCAALNTSILSVSGGALGRITPFSNNKIRNNIARNTLPGTSEPGASKTETELKTQAPYEAIGWKFGNDDSDNPWKMAPNGYPVF
jgi:uncharacterized repeat protein (TIGR02543 family)